jgi:hypothetical protein
LAEAPLIVVPAMRVGHDAGAKHDEGADAEGSDDKIDAAHEALPVPAGSTEPAPHEGTPREQAVLQIAARACVERVKGARDAGSAQSDEHDPRGDPSEARRDHQSPKQEVIVVFAEERRPAVHHADRTAAPFVSLPGAGALTLFTH